MKPGRELDALIAEKVMGWIVNRLSEQTMPPVLRGPGTFSAVDLHPYSTDIAAAWEVMEKLIKIAKKIDKMSLPSIYCLSAKHYRVSIDLEDRYIEGSANTVPHAICLAALKAVGVEI